MQRFYAKFNKGYDGLANRYQGLIGYVAGRKLITLGLLLLFFVGTWGIQAILPSGFIPAEDQGVIYIDVTTPAGATVERTEQVLDAIQQQTRELEVVEAISTLAGYSMVNGVSGASYGMGMISLKPWHKRDEGVDEIIRQLQEKTSGITDARIEFSTPPTVPGFGNASGFDLRILDRTGGDDLQRLGQLSQEFIQALEEAPEIRSAYTNYDANFPQYLIHVDQEMAAKKGVTIQNAMGTLETLMGGRLTSDFLRFGQMYDVMVQAHPDYRAKPEDLLHLHVKNNKGEMVPLSTFVRLERMYGPEQLTRYNMYTAARIGGTVAPGYSTGDAIEAVQRVASQTLPRGFGFDWAGMTREEVKSGDQALWIFLICLLFVYLLLAAQYESFLLPLPVILSLPTGIFGAFLALQLFGLQNNIYAQVALIMLIGILGKNAILIIEFAIQRRQEGLSVMQAALEGSVARLRPILMTSFAFIAGLIPLCIATGAGAMGNRSIGTAAAGGMLIGTIFGLILIPGLYVIFAQMGSRAEQTRKDKQEKAINAPEIPFSNN
ncbi:putative efflux pump membrane transporter TtgB [Cesiribacter andamanensis AMV16]|uniref:Putative efflux pump membrane transporter TtgB n=1 Tax=Cesiribacter andamanensis AMV16 TaxID=1279009 RepID=M7N7Z3_9BACT|nr:putative efflux pump membrane transporter TtgB [Cesiribacter andamanensis AMV16]